MIFICQLDHFSNFLVGFAYLPASEHDTGVIGRKHRGYDFSDLSHFLKGFHIHYQLHDVVIEYVF